MRECLCECLCVCAEDVCGPPRSISSRHLRTATHVLLPGVASKQGGRRRVHASEEGRTLLRVARRRSSKKRGRECSAVATINNTRVFAPRFVGLLVRLSSRCLPCSPSLSLALTPLFVFTGFRQLLALHTHLHDTTHTHTHRPTHTQIHAGEKQNTCRPRRRQAHHYRAGDVLLKSRPASHRLSPIHTCCSEHDHCMLGGFH